MNSAGLFLLYTILQIPPGAGFASDFEVAVTNGDVEVF